MEKHSITSRFDELELSLIVTRPEGREKGILQICHGMCEHKERYIPFMEYMSADGWYCVLHDHRGHGESIKSEEDLGFMYSGGWKALVDDVKLVNEWIAVNLPKLPVVLFGHSMGSMVVRSYAKRWDSSICALIVCGCPSWNPATGMGKMIAGFFKLFKGGKGRPKLLQKLSFGSFNKPFEHEGENAWVVSDSDARALYNSDPLCQFQFTANGFHNLLGLCQDCYSSKGWAMKNPDMPVRFISGGDDPCRVDDRQLEKAVALMQKVGYNDVELTVYDGMRHEILNESGKMTVWEDVRNFIGSVVG